jgi:hypothetical protein
MYSKILMGQNGDKKYHVPSYLTTLLLSTKLQNNYGTIGTFARDSTYPVRGMSTRTSLAERFPDLDEAGLDRMYVSQVDRLLKQEARDEEDKSQMYAYLKSTVSLEGWEKVKLRTNFADVERSSDPLDLLKLIILEHSLQSGNISTNEAKFLAETTYNRLHMTSRMTMLDYITGEWLSDRLLVQEGLGLPDDSSGVDKVPELQNGLAEGDIGLTYKQIGVPNTPLDLSISILASGSNKGVSTVSSYSFHYKLVVI